MAKSSHNKKHKSKKSNPTPQLPEKRKSALPIPQSDPTQPTLQTLSKELALKEYQFTTAPIHKYPRPIQSKIEEGYELVTTDPLSAVETLREWCDQYPHVPVFCNYMCICYERIGDRKQKEYWLKETFRRHPDYLIGRLNLAKFYLLSNDMKQLEELMEGKWDLEVLAPQRKKFHITEGLTFFGVLGHYKLRTHQLQQAMACYRLLEQIDPHHPETQLLRRHLYPVRSIFRFIGNGCLVFLLALLWLPFAAIKWLFDMLKKL